MTTFSKHAVSGVALFRLFTNLFVSHSTEESWALTSAPSSCLLRCHITQEFFWNSPPDALAMGV